METSAANGNCLASRNRLLALGTEARRTAEIENWGDNMLRTKTFRAIGMAWLVVSQLGVGQEKAPEPTAAVLRQFVGSSVCVSCHEHQANSWGHSLHSRFMRTWKEELINPIVNWTTSPVAPFDTNDVAYVLGNMHKLVFLRTTAEGHAFCPQQFDIASSKWERLDTGLWASSDADQDSDSDTRKQWEQMCAGCHVTGYDAKSKTFVEASIACEDCHGPGSAHAKSTRRDDIVNPAALDDELANYVCARCHSRGRDLRFGLPYPVGFVAGDDLARTFSLESPTPDKNSPAFWGNGAARVHHAQFNEFRQSKHFRSDVKCFDCHEVHRFRARAPSKETRLMARTERYSLASRARFICLKCHENRETDYGTVTHDGKVLDAHTHHPPVIERGGPGDTAANADPKPFKRMECPDCHMVKVAGGENGYDTRSHSFRVPAPQDTVKYGVPNACNNCHKKESAEWAQKQIVEWRKLPR